MFIRCRSLVAAADEYSCEFGSPKYYALCAVGGALSCGITHTAVTPLDLVKCRLQVRRKGFDKRNYLSCVCRSTRRSTSLWAMGSS